MLDSVIDLLACPHCASTLDLDGSTVLCDSGHSFDVAKQGYVSLLDGATRFTGDTAEMIAARSEFLGAGHYDPIRRAVAEACAATPTAGPILEIGAGAGHYLSFVLDSLDGGRGIGLDISKPAARRLARCHADAGAVVADVWQRWPVRSGAVGHVLAVFAPRNAAEIHRVLEPGGTLVVVTPTDAHLREVVALPGTVGVDDRKTERLAAALSGLFERTGRTEVRFTMALAPSEVGLLVGMGPSAFHLTAAQRAEMVADLPEALEVGASVVVSTWRRT